MRELLPELENWLEAGEKVAIATVISTWGSAPRRPGSMMAISESGDFAGSVSGGCVEGAVIQTAEEVIKTQNPKRLHFGVADETAWDVGLACGGEIDIFIQPYQSKTHMPLLERIKENKGSILSTIVAGDEAILGSQNLTDEKGKLLASTNGLISLTELSDKPRIVVGQNTEVFVHPFAPPPTLVIIGGAHIAIALAEFARTLDFKVVIIDPRKAFSKAARFPNVDELIREWPQSAFDHFSLNKSTAVASLSHDPKIDDPALITALNSEAFYIGALGSAKTQEKRRLRLLKAGISEEALSRLHAPIGMEIGAETSEEIALAVMAQVIAAYRG